METLKQVLYDRLGVQILLRPWPDWAEWLPQPWYSEYLQASQRDEETKDVITALKYSEDAQISQDTFQSTFLDMKQHYILW